MILFSITLFASLYYDNCGYFEDKNVHCREHLRDGESSISFLWYIFMLILHVIEPLFFHKTILIVCINILDMLDLKFGSVKGNKL